MSSTLLNNTTNDGSIVASNAKIGSLVLSQTQAGQVTIPIGASTSVIKNPAITANAAVFLSFTNAAADATLTTVSAAVVVGQLTITGNANATAAVKVNYFIAAF